MINSDRRMCKKPTVCTQTNTAACWLASHFKSQEQGELNVCKVWDLGCKVPRRVSGIVERVVATAKTCLALWMNDR